MNDHACPSGESSIAANWSPHDLFHANENNSVGYQSHLLFPEGDSCYRTMRVFGYPLPILKAGFGYAGCRSSYGLL